MRLATRILAVCLIGLAPVGGARAVAQEADTPRLSGAAPSELMVDRRDGRTVVTLHGKGLNHPELIWTPRLFRYYVRRAGDSSWRRLYIRPQGPGLESEEQLAPLRANGVATGWTLDSRVLELPNAPYFQSPGALEFRVERGEWKQRSYTHERKTYTEPYYVTAAVSNTLRVPIRATPTEAPVVTRLEPAHVPVLGSGAGRATIGVHAENLTPSARVTVGTEPCEVTLNEPVRGRITCILPTSLQSAPGMYLVGVSTENGGARRLGRLEVQAPLELRRPEPSVLPVTDAGAGVVVGYRGSAPLRARIRVDGGDWSSASFEAAGADRVRVEVPRSLTRGSGRLELELSNAAGPAVAAILVCGPGGDLPAGCPRTVAAAQPARVTAEGVTVERPRTPVQRAPVVLDAHALRPQPEPPGLVAVSLATRGTLRMADGGSVAWRRIDGAQRLVLVDGSGAVVRTFDPGAALVQDAGGKVFVRVSGGVVPVGQAASRPR